MSFKLIIAEKPSVARDIARVIGANERVSKTDITCYKGGNYIVANATGHFLTLSEPSSYGYGWNVDELPMCPQNFTLTPIKEHAGRLKALVNLINSADITSLVCATDAGREGELIFRYIYYYSGCKKPFERLWISSLTDESIIHGMKNLRPGTEKDRIFQAGITRAKSDWIFGMNLSRLYMALYKQKYTVGRVQTPTLAMIAERDCAIVNFKKTPFFTLSLENSAGWFADEGGEVVTSFPTKEQAENVKKQCEGKIAVVTKADTKRKTENRPLLYSLTSLQKDANEKHGFSAARTLVTMQDLYEKKLLTYPRTDSNCITEDMKNSCTELVRLLAFHSGEQSEKLLRQGLNLDKRVVDNSKVTDHHAIIPTYEISKIQTMELSPDEKTIAEMVIERFLTALDQPHIYDETEYVFDIDGETFRLVIKVSVSPGWREFDRCGDTLSTSANYSLNDKFTAEKIILGECETQPPRAFTESTLLSAMEHISRRIDDKEKSEFVKEHGLGTPATRAAIIERLLKLGFTERKNKQIRSTENGRVFLSFLPGAVKSVEMTADIESMLSDIERGEKSAGAALSKVIEIVKSVVETECKKAPAVVQTTKPILGKCPKCGSDIIEIKQGYVCSNENKCMFAIWKNDFFWKDRKKELTATIVKEILAKGKSHVKGLYSEKKDKTYDAWVSFNEYTGKDGKIRIGYKMEF